MRTNVGHGASGSMILCYHRVGEGHDDPFRLSVTPENFAAHLDEITRHCEPSTLDELDLPSRRPRVIVTFDDGYADNLTNALPIAEAKGVPITVFVTSGLLGGQEGFWWDRLGTLLRARPPQVREVRIPTADGPVHRPWVVGQPSRDLQAVRHHLLPLPVTEIHRVLDAVADQWGTCRFTPPDARTLTASELGQLANSDVVTIGAHTTDHVRLRGLPGAGAKGDHLLVQAGARAALRADDLAFRLPLWWARQLRRQLCRRRTPIGFETACTTVPGPM